MTDAPDTTFAQFELPPQLQQALVKLNFTNPTPIQARTIPLALQGRDIIGCAQTGTGKTAAFCIPLIARLAADHGKDALILAPTRELAQQITDVLRKLVETLPRLRPALIMGGASMRIQHQVLRRHPRIIVATPGRMIDHLSSKSISLDRIGFLVLDEADQMMDMGFAPQLNQILKFLPNERQTLLFSATLPEKIMELAGRFLKNPERVTVGQNAKPIEAITQSVVRTTGAKKNDLLLDELNARKGSTLIFVRTKSRTEKLYQYLEEYGYEVARIHGGRSQAQRSQALRGFRDGAVRVLVATDIAARGLDIPLIEHVINFDLPMAPEDYVHRIGRTARAGRVGEALAILLPEDENQWRRITRLIDPNAKKEKTFSRPPIGPNSRRFDDRERRQDRAPSRGPASAARPFSKTRSDSRPRPNSPPDSRAESRPTSSPRATGARPATRAGARPFHRADAQPRPDTDWRPRAHDTRKSNERFERDQRPKRPFAERQAEPGHRFNKRRSDERPDDRRFAEARFNERPDRKQGTEFRGAKSQKPRGRFEGAPQGPAAASRRRDHSFGKGMGPTKGRATSRDRFAGAPARRGGF